MGRRPRSLVLFGIARYFVRRFSRSCDLGTVFGTVDEANIVMEVDSRPPPHGFACRGAAKSSVWHISTNFGLVSRKRPKRNPRSCSAASWEYGIRAGLACQTGDFAARRHSEIVRRPGSTANPLIGPAALPCARASLPSLVGGRPSNQPSNSTACGNYLHVSLFFGNFAIMTDRVHVLRVFHTCAPVAEYTRKRG